MFDFSVSIPLDRLHNQGFKGSNQPWCLPIAGGIVAFILFQRVIAPCEIQWDTSKIWTRVTVIISCNDKHYERLSHAHTHTHTHIYICVCVCVCVCGLHKPLYKIKLIFIIIIMSHLRHGYPWPSLATYPYRSSPLVGLQGHIPYPRIAAGCMFEQVVLLLPGHMWGSKGVHHLWARPCFSSSDLRVWFVKLG